MRSQTTRTYTSTVVVNRDDVMSAVWRLENCIDDVSHWMSANRLKFNADKSALLWAGSRQKVRPCWGAWIRHGDGHGE